MFIFFPMSLLLFPVTLAGLLFGWLLRALTRDKPYSDPSGDRSKRMPDPRYTEWR